MEDVARHAPGGAMPKLPPRKRKGSASRAASNGAQALPGLKDEAEAPCAASQRIGDRTATDAPSSRPSASPAEVTTNKPATSEGKNDTSETGVSAGTPKQAHSAQAAKSATPAKSATGGATAAIESNGDHSTPPKEKKSSGRLGPLSSASSTARALAKEEPRTQELRKKVHALRVLMMRAALRLGWEEHYVHQVMYRLQFAENLQLPRPIGTQRGDPAKAAIKEAKQEEAEQGPGSQLDLKMTILLVGLEGGGKTSLAHRILHPDEDGPAPTPEPTTKVGALNGSVAGVAVRIIDTPGLSLDPRKVHQNMMRLKQVRRAYHQLKPDTIIFVDRVDRKQGGDDELAVLRSLTNGLGGPAFWCNTVVAFMRAGSVSGSNSSSQSCSNGGPVAESRAPAWQIQTKQKEVGLQALIREVSGDPRLMNPVLWVESGPCKKNASGQPVVFEGHPWCQHMYLMLLSAKILAECEALFGLQMNVGKPSGAGRMPDSGPPMSFLLTSLTTINEPLRYQERATVELRKLKHLIGQAPSAWSRKKARLEFANAARQLKMQERYRMSIMKSKVDRVVFAPGPRSTTDPKMPQRYAAVMASDRDGFLLTHTIARPQIDNRLVLDHCDGIVGVQLEHGVVLRAKEKVTASISVDGIPALLTCAAQAGKDRLLVQARAESAIYHDWLERNVTGLTMDVQTNGSVTNMDTLYNVQVDKHLRGIPSKNSVLTAGAFVSRYAPNGLPHRGPASLGLRLQSRLPTGLLIKGCPLLLSWCLGRMFCRMNGESERGWGATAEVKMDPAEGSRGGPPLTLSASALHSKGELTTGAALNWQTQVGRHKYGAMAQVMGNKGRLKLRARMMNSYWLTAVGVLPLLVNLYYWCKKRWAQWRTGSALQDAAQARSVQKAHAGRQQQQRPVR